VPAPRCQWAGTRADPSSPTVFPCGLLQPACLSEPFVFVCAAIAKAQLYKKDQSCRSLSVVMQYSPFSRLRGESIPRRESALVTRLRRLHCNGGSSDGWVCVREMRYECRLHDVRKVWQRARASNDLAPGRIKRSRCTVPRRPWQSEVTDVLRAGYDLHHRGREDLRCVAGSSVSELGAPDIGRRSRVMAQFTTACKR
jgi:hypothetical protein